ncbi:MAG: hypothetical protein LN561_06025 [Rickettsia endosymbiont of Labidopullus appendiculatus]|nr:hypothetical protein [Rickettsia endosymbiont of Labidopullus appendiculatus]
MYFITQISYLIHIRIFFVTYDQQGTGKFKLWLMNNDEKYMYARYIQAIGVYHSTHLHYSTAIKYILF